MKYRTNKEHCGAHSGKHTQNFKRAFVADKPIPRVEAVSALTGRNVLVTWRSGARQVVDLTPALVALAGLSPVKFDDALFRTVRPGPFGATVEWDDGSELSALWVEEMALAQMDNVEFRSAMDRLGITLDGMAALLGVSRRTVAEYRKSKVVPRYIALALHYILELRGLQKAS